MRKLDEILAQQEIIRSDQLHIRDLQMATLAQVQQAQTDETTAITAQTQAITDLTARIAALPQGAASATDLDGLLATAQTNTATATSNTAAITAIDPATVPAS